MQKVGLHWCNPPLIQIMEPKEGLCYKRDPTCTVRAVASRLPYDPSGRRWDTRKVTARLMASSTSGSLLPHVRASATIAHSSIGGG